MSDWTDELKQEVVDKYLAADPTAENSVEIVKQIAEEVDKTPNGVRMVLSRANVYVKKEGSSSSSKATTSGTASKRVNKAEAIDALKKAITKLNQDVDDDILDRLTGKAAIYLKSVLDAVS